MPKKRIEGFFRRTFNDMKEYFDEEDWESFLASIDI